MNTVKAILYLRSSKDAHDVSPAAQRTELREFAQSKGYKIVGEYVDAAVSANDDPPELAALLRELKNRDRGWQAVLAIDSSRIARDADLAGVINYQVRKAGCRIEYSKMPSTANAAMDVMMESIMRGFDHFWSLTAKQKGLAGMKTNVELGHRAGGRAPLGYTLEHTTTGAIRRGEPVRKSHLVLDPVSAPRVKRYLQLRARGVLRGVAARKARLAPKSLTTLLGIERNALTYAGITVWNRMTDRKAGAVERYRPREDWVLKRGTHEGMIDEQSAEMIMAAAMPKGRRRGPSSEMLLAGLLFTPDGKPLTASGDGFYRVAPKGRRINATVLEAVVLDRCNEDVDSHEFIDKFIAQLRKATRDLGAEPEDLQRRREAVEQKIAKLLRLAEKVADSTALAERLQALEADRARLAEAAQRESDARRMRRAVEAVTPEAAGAALRAAFERDAAQPEERRAALGQLIERVELNPATGAGRILYKVVPALQGKFRVREDARELGLGDRGMVASGAPGRVRYRPASPVNIRRQTQNNRIIFAGGFGVVFGCPVTALTRRRRSMARPTKEYDSTTKTARARLAPRAKPYYRHVGPGKSLGYVRTESGRGSGSCASTSRGGTPRASSARRTTSGARTGATSSPSSRRCGPRRRRRSRRPAARA